MKTSAAVTHKLRVGFARWQWHHARRSATFTGTFKFSVVNYHEQTSSFSYALLYSTFFQAISCQNLDIGKVPLNTVCINWNTEGKLCFTTHLHHLPFDLPCSTSITSLVAWKCTRSCSAVFLEMGVTVGGWVIYSTCIHCFVPL